MATSSESEEQIIRDSQESVRRAFQPTSNDEDGSVYRNNDGDDDSDANANNGRGDRRSRSRSLGQDSDAEVIQPQPIKRGRGRPPKPKDHTEVKGLPKKLQIDHIGDAANKAVLKDLTQWPIRYDLAEAYVQKENIGKDITSLEHVFRHFPEPKTSEFFSEQDWVDVKRAWRKDPLRKRKLNIGANDDMVTLYKMCLAHLKCLPEDIICRHNYLAYNDCDNRINKETKQKSLVWAASFCELLAGLILHPLFQRRVDLLVTAIQYTVITISGDRNPWLFHTEAWDKFPSCVQEESQNGERRKMVDIRLKVLDKTPNSRESAWNNLFERIETIAALEKYSREPKLTGARRKANEPYMVHSLHLDMLTKALDTMGPTGLPMYHPISIFKVILDGRRSVGSYPRKEDLEQLRDYSIPRQNAFDLVFDRSVKSKEPRPVQQNSRAATTAPGSRNVRESNESRRPRQSSGAGTMAPELARSSTTARPGKTKAAPRRSARMSDAPFENLAILSKKGSTQTPDGSDDCDPEPSKKRRRSSHPETMRNLGLLDGVEEDESYHRDDSPPPVKRKRLSKPQAKPIRDLEDSELEEASDDEDISKRRRVSRLQKGRRSRFVREKEKRPNHRRAHSDLTANIPGPDPEALANQLFRLDDQDDSIEDHGDGGLPPPNDDDSGPPDHDEISDGSNGQQISTIADSKSLSSQEHQGPGVPRPGDLDWLLEAAKYPELGDIPRRTYW